MIEVQNVSCPARDARSAVALPNSNFDRCWNLPGNRQFAFIVSCDRPRSRRWSQEESNHFPRATAIRVDWNYFDLGIE